MFIPTGHIMWSCFSQTRDITANDNMTRFDMNRMASDIESWAASKKGNKAFAQVCYSAAKEAQRMRKQARG